MTTTQQRFTAGGVEKPPYSWAGREWVPASNLAPLIPAAGLALAVGLVHWLNVPWWAWILGVPVIFAVAALAAAGSKYTQALTLYMWIFGGYAAVYYGWACTDVAWRLGPVTWGTVQMGHNYLWWTLAAGGAATFAAVALWSTVRRAQMIHESRQYAVHLRIAPAQLVAAPEQMQRTNPKSERARQWEYVFTACGKTGLTFVQEHETDGNLSIRMRLPGPGMDPANPTGIQFAAIAQQTFRAAVEQYLDLRPGAVRFEQARKSDGSMSSLDFWMHLDYEDILAKIVPVDDDHEPMSISDAFKIARMADGTWLSLNLREIHGMIIGATRNGKSTLLHVIIYQVSRCYDAATWMIDLKGGATARPWLRAWVEGKAARPLLDWVAIDRWEAARILLACIDIVRDRPGRRRGSKTEPQRMGMPMAVTDPTTGKARVATIERPAIVLITDEVAEMVGTATGPAMADKDEGLTSAALSNLMTRFAALGAGEAVYGLFAGQRSTSDAFGNPTAQKNIGLKIAVGNMDRQDAAMVFGNSAPDAAEMVSTLQHKGSIVAWWAGTDKVLPSKVMFPGDGDTLDAFCYATSIAHDGISPSVEQDRYANARAAEWDYADRWSQQRCGWLYLNEDEEGAAFDDEGGVVGWEGVPIPLDAAYKPIPLSRRRDQETRRAAMDARAAATAGTAVLDQDAARGFWPAAPASPDAPGDAGRLRDDPAAVGELVDEMTRYLNEPEGTPPPAGADPDDGPADRGEAYRRTEATAKIVDGYGTAGVAPTELAHDMIAAGLITAAGIKAYRKYVLRAMEPGGVLDPALRVRQPGGNGTRYYTDRHVN